MIKKKKIVTFILGCADYIFGRGISVAILGRNVKRIRCRGLKIVYKIGMSGILSHIWNSLRISSSVFNIECNDSKCLSISSIKGRYPMYTSTCYFTGKCYISRNVWFSFKKNNCVCLHGCIQHLPFRHLLNFWTFFLI